MKKLLFFAAALSLICFQSVMAADFQNIQISGQPSDWDTQQAVFGPWSFFVTNQFYKPDTYNNKETYTYSDEEVLRSRPAVFSDTYTSIAWPGTQASLQRAGLVIASNKGNNPDNNWRCALEVYPGSADNTVRFVTQPRAKDCSSPVGITSCFTVPEDGSYQVVTAVENYGWVVNGLFNYGTTNMARVSILTGGETKETSDNSFEFEILKKGAAEKSYDSGIISLKKGDRIYLSVFNGNDGNLDDFLGTHTIYNYDGEGNIIKTYSLGDVSFSNTGEWNFFKSAPDNTNIYAYIPMYAVKPEWMSYDYGVTGGYASVPSSEWKDGIVSMPKTGSVSWNEGDDFVTVKTAADDIIITKDIEKDGEYLIKAEAENTGTYQISDGAVISISKISGFITDDSDIIGKMTVPESSNEPVWTARLKQLSAGDRILVRVNKNVSATADVLKLKISIDEAAPGMHVKCMSAGKEITSVSDIEAGAEFGAEAKYVNYENENADIAVFAAFYNENDVIENIAALPVVNMAPFEEKTFNLITIPEKKPAKIIFFAWSGYMNPNALSPMTIIE